MSDVSTVRAKLQEVKAKLSDDPTNKELLAKADQLLVELVSLLDSGKR